MLVKTQGVTLAIHFFPQSLAPHLKHCKDLKDLQCCVSAVLCESNMLCCFSVCFCFNLPAPVAGLPVDAAGYDSLM